MLGTESKSRSLGQASRVISVILFLLIGLTACGSTVLMIRLDILSFLAGEAIVTDYGIDPPIPGNSPPVTIRTPAEIIPLPDEIRSVTEVQSVELSTVIAFRNETGEARFTYGVFFHGEAAGIFDTPPVIVRTVNLAPDSEITQETVVMGDDRVLALFDSDEFAVAADLVIEPAGGTEKISGQAELIDFIAVIVAVGERK